MISTDLQRVQIQDIIEYQLPAFVRDDFPLVGEFLKQYYISQEYQGGPSDIINNLDHYLKVDNLVPEVVVGAVFSADRHPAVKSAALHDVSIAFLL